MHSQSKYRGAQLIIRALLAAWILIVVVVLCAVGHWWGLVFLIPLAADLVLIRRLLASPPR